MFSNKYNNYQLEYILFTSVIMGINVYLASISEKHRFCWHHEYWWMFVDGHDSLVLVGGMKAEETAAGLLSDRGNSLFSFSTKAWSLSRGHQTPPEKSSQTMKLNHNGRPSVRHPPRSHPEDRIPQWSLGAGPGWAASPFKRVYI